jgi:hypothetical protein
MTWRVIQFGDLVLPNYDPQINLGTGQALSALVELPGGGVFDQYGDEDRPMRPMKFTKRAVIHDENRSTLQDLFDALKAYAGKKESISLLSLDGDEEYRWAEGSVEVIDGPRRPGDMYTQDVEINWLIDRPLWHGALRAGWYFDDGYYLDDGLYFDESNSTTLDASPKTVTANNGGNATVEDAIITVTAGSAPITALKIERQVSGTTYEELDFTGTIATGKALVIDVGAWSVLNDGVDAFNDLAMGSDHKSECLLKLLPGDNTIIVTITGGSTDSTIAFAYYDLWK